MSTFIVLSLCSLVPKLPFCTCNIVPSLDLTLFPEKQFRFYMGTIDQVNVINSRVILPKNNQIIIKNLRDKKTSKQIFFYFVDKIALLSIRLSSSYLRSTKRLKYIYLFCFFISSEVRAHYIVSQIVFNVNTDTHPNDVTSLFRSGIEMNEQREQHNTQKALYKWSERRWTNLNWFHLFCTIKI